MQKLLPLAVLLWAACPSSSSTVADGGVSDGAVASGFEILPKKIYSGWDGVNSYVAPIIARGATNVTWTIGDAALAQLTPEADTTQLTLTTLKAGSTTITAHDGTKTATAELVITAYTQMQRTIGEMRYGTAQGGDPSCASCHAGIAGPDHTPTLLEVDTDAQIINTFLTGVTAEGQTIQSARHIWNVTEPQKIGLVAFLRSLPPRGFPDPNNL